jgi:hypothetical protein
MPAVLGLDDDSFIFNIQGRDNILLADGGGLNISTNAGLFWTQVEEWQYASLRHLAMDSKHNIYLGTFSLYKIDVDGKNNKKISKDIPGAIEKSTVDNKDRVYLTNRTESTSSLYRSDNGGETWQLLQSFNFIGNFTVLDNGKILLTTDQGLIISDETQLHYTPLTPSFSTSSVSCGWPAPSMGSSSDSYLDSSIAAALLCV